jgi:glycosyltransferase involved in cell wall biosynthesis
VREAAAGSPLISYLGQLDRTAVFQQMRSAHALVFPSEWYEALPVTLLEAFACRLPIIAADRGAAGEIVRQDQTGMLFTAGDDRALAAQVSWAAQHPDALSSMGLAARQEYEVKYSADSNYDQLLRIYRLALDGGAAPESGASSGDPPAWTPGTGTAPGAGQA